MALPGVTHVQMHAALLYDDGRVVNLVSPLFSKNIRHGDFFTDEQIGELLVFIGHKMAEQVETEQAWRMHADAKRGLEKHPNWWRRPKWDEPFSMN